MNSTQNNTETPLACLSQRDRLFVLQCIQVAAGVSTQILYQPDSMEDVVELLCYHRLVPLLYEQLSKCELSPSQKHKCRLELTKTVKRLHEKSAHYGIVQAVMDQAGIPYAPLKGMANLRTIYANKPVRFMNDLDVMVRADDIDRAYHALYDAGFRPFDRPTRHRWHYHLLREEAWKNFPYIEHLNGRVMMLKDGVELDLHWDPSFDEKTDKNIPPKDFYWNNASRTSSGSAAYDLAPERQLLLQCLHAAGDSYPKLLHLVDFMRLWRRSSIDLSSLTNEPWIVEKDAINYFLNGVTALSSNNTGIETALQFANYYIDAPRRKAPMFSDVIEGGEALRFHAEVLRRLRPSHKLLYLAGFLIPDPTYYSGKSETEMWRLFYADFLRAVKRVLISRDGTP